MNDDIKTLILSVAEKRGATVTFRNTEGVQSLHVQIRGSLLVNFYPLSARRSAYVAGTTKGRHYVTPEEAVAMAFEAPPIAAESAKDQRSKNSKRIRQAVGAKKGWFCHWCGCALTLATSTVEHVIPLARGGLDNANNRVLACEKCNHERGHEMPELRIDSA